MGAAGGRIIIPSLQNETEPWRNGAAWPKPHRESLAGTGFESRALETSVGREQFFPSVQKLNYHIQYNSADSASAPISLPLLQ